MTTLNKGAFCINLGIVKLTGTLSEEDRQCAWELYTELSTRVAMIGKSNDDNCDNFEGELYIESLSSFYNFFQQSRGIMRKFPVGKIETTQHDHLGVIISKMMSGVMRPFLEKWQVKYRYWWENQSNPRISPIERQEAFPEIEEFLQDWSSVRWLLRKLQKELVEKYKLVDVTG
nr:hypothetical protein [uncultured Desulfobacter sp.]